MFFLVSELEWHRETGGKILLFLSCHAIHFRFFSLIKACWLSEAASITVTLRHDWCHIAGWPAWRQLLPPFFGLSEGVKKPGRDGDTFSDAAAQLRVATPGKMADFFREFCNHGSFFFRRLTYRRFLGRFLKWGRISIVEVVHFLIFGIPLDIVEASRALQSHAAEGGGCRDLHE